MQQNSYKGTAPRCWVTIRFAAPDGSFHDRELLADTGSPCAVILGQVELNKLFHAPATAMTSNFGNLLGGWLRIEMPDLGLATHILGFGSDQVLGAVQSDCPDFAGLIGLPLLRMTEYGGDAASFWLRQAGQSP